MKTHKQVYKAINMKIKEGFAIAGKFLLLGFEVVKKIIVTLFGFLYSISMSVLKSKGGKRIVHFLVHGALHIFLGFMIFLICIYCHREATKDVNPAYKHITIRVSSPQNSIPVDFLSITSWFHSNDVKKYWRNNQMLSIELAYKKLKINDSIKSNKIICDDYTFYPYYYENECKFTHEPVITNALSTISFYAPDAQFRDAIGDTIKDRVVARDNHRATMHSFSKIDSICPHYISHTQYFNIDESHSLTEAISGDNIFSNNGENPYYRFFLELDMIPGDISEDSDITINLSDKDSIGNYQTPINFISIYPEPNIIRPNKIQYTGSDNVKNVIKNGGVYIFMEDINRKNESDKHIFLCTVLLGAFLAFLFDIVVNLIIKWKNLADRN